nr:MAG TPA: hypothetical protein [Caudoviricetes sp.]
MSSSIRKVNRIEIDPKGSNDHPRQWTKMHDSVEVNIPRAVHGDYHERN